MNNTIIKEGNDFTVITSPKESYSLVYLNFSNNSKKRFKGKLNKFFGKLNNIMELTKYEEAELKALRSLQSNFCRPFTLEEDRRLKELVNKKALHSCTNTK